MDSNIAIFDRHRIRANRDRAARQGKGSDFLHQWATENLCDRLRDVNREFPLALRIGASGGDAFDKAGKIGTLFTMDLSTARLTTGLSLQADEEMLPFAASSLDLVLSPLALHTVNDLPGALLQIRQSLKPDGLFLAAMLGGETLHELRDAMMVAESCLRDGVSPRVAPFADKPQAGALLQRAGFALPVVDSEIVTVTYDSAFHLMRDLRLMGEGNAVANRDKVFAGRDLFMETARIYAEKYAEPDGRIVATFEIIFLIGWAPHDSQQKPLRPGSAKRSLADALGSCEISTGEKAS